MPYTQITRAELRSLLQAKWDETPFWGETEANAALNEALQWYNLYTGVWRQRVVFPTVAAQVWYATPSAFIAPLRVEWNGKSLAMSSLYDLDMGRPEWQSETTADADTPDEPQLWAPAGMTTLALWPADATDDNSLLIDGLLVTPTMDTDAATIDLDDSDIDAVVGEALHIATFKDPARWPRTAGGHQAFLAAVTARNGRLNASDAFRQFTGTDQQRATAPPRSRP